MWTKAITTTLLLAVASCAAVLGEQTELTPKGARVAFNKSDPPAGCREVGYVAGFCNAYEGGDLGEPECKNMLRNAAAQKSGNYVRLDNVTVDRSVSRKSMTGTAYQCP